MAFESYSYNVGGGGGGGSLSSSSSLSALAPPFMVVQSFPKSDLNNFTEVPYTPLFDPSVSIWHPHHSLNPTSGPNYFESEPVNTACEPQPGNYRSPNFQLNNSANAHYSSLSPVDSRGCITTFDLFPYDKYTNLSTVPTSLAGPKSYYSHLSSLGYDDSHPLVHQEPSFELASNSGVTQLGGYSQAGFVENLSGMNYSSPRNQYYTGSADGERREWSELCAKFGSKDNKLSDTASGRSYVNPDEHATEGFVSYRDASVAPGKCYDNFERVYQYHEPKDRKPFLQYDLRANNIECSDEPAISSTFKGITQTVQESTENICSSQISHNLSSDVKSSFVFGDTSTTKADTIALMKPPSSVCADFVEYDSFNLKEPHHPFKPASSSTVSTFDLFRLPTFNNEADTMEVKSGVDKIFGDLSKSEPAALRLDLNISDDSMLRSDGTEAIYFQKRSHDPDLYSHIVDSPCWKGAPATHVSPSIAFESLASKPTVECGSKMVNENTSVPCKLGEENSDSVCGSWHIKREDEDGLKFGDSICLAYESAKENTLLPQPLVTSYVSRKCLDSDYTQGFCDSKQNGELGEEHKFTCLTKCEPVPCDAIEKNRRTSTASVGVFCDLPPHAKDHVHTLPGFESMTSYSQPSEIVSNSKVVSYVVTTMKELSELLYYLNPTDICQQDQVAMKHVINNLNACIANEATKSPLTGEEGVFPLHGTPVQDRATGVCSEQERELPASDIICLDSGKILEDKRLGSDVFRREDKDFQGSISLNHNMERSLDFKSVQAIQSVLHANIHGKEEKDPQALLYKNLWLEAEAALCAATTKARFCQMKLKMEEHAFHKENEETADAEHVPITRVSSYARGVPDPMVPTDASPAPVVCTRDPPSSVDDDDSSVMGRCNVPTSLMSQISYLETEGQQSPKKENYVPSCDCQSPGICTEHINESSMSGIDCDYDDSSYIRALKLEWGKSLAKHEESQSPRKENFRPPSDCESYANEPNLSAYGADIEASVMSRYQITKSCQDDLDLLNNAVVERKDVHESFKDTPALEQPVQDSYFSSTTADTNNTEASILARFRILRSRIENSNSRRMGTTQLLAQAIEPTLPPANYTEDGFSGQDSIQETNSLLTEKNLCNSFSDRPENKTEPLSDPDASKPFVGNWLISQVLEDWYSGSSSDWEHI